MDPWEVVKWIAIFRLILPEALFRLCGGRVENLGELQATAVRAGLNGVMMGNFLTTLGNTPEQDQQMFTDAGLNIARQDDNGANPRPDNRSGWLQGETPDVVTATLADEPARSRSVSGTRRRSCASPPSEPCPRARTALRTAVTTATLVRRPPAALTPPEPAAPHRLTPARGYGGMPRIRRHRARLADDDRRARRRGARACPRWPRRRRTSRASADRHPRRRRPER